MNRLKIFGTLFAFSLLLLLGIPSLASAQYRNDDDHYGNNRRDNSGYNRQFLVDAVRRVERDSRTFRRALDRELDHSRYDKTNREDRINDVTERFATATDNLKDSFDNGNNIRSSSDEARTVFQLASQIDRFMNRNSFGGNVENQWSGIRRDLQTIANAYGENFNGGYNNRRNRDDNNNRRTNNPRWGRFPFPN
ncbi:MAG: hypothetical protein ABI954_13195 [Pyrinomonadaceae bacterium]